MSRSSHIGLLSHNTFCGRWIDSFLGLASRATVGKKIRQRQKKKEEEWEISVTQAGALCAGLHMFYETGQTK